MKNSLLFVVEFGNAPQPDFSSFDRRQHDVNAVELGESLQCNRLCHPGSELAVEQHWYPSTALDDLLHIAKGKMNDTRLYRCLDRLFPCKTKLEQHLKQRFGGLFQAEFDVLLYDFDQHVCGRGRRRELHDAARVFLNRCAQPMTRFGVHDIITRHARSARAHCPRLRKKNIGPHTIRHTSHASSSPWSGYQHYPRVAWLRVAGDHQHICGD